MVLGECKGKLFPREGRSDGKSSQRQAQSCEVDGADPGGSRGEAWAEVAASYCAV